MIRRHKQGWFSNCWIIQRLFCCLIEMIKPDFVVCILKCFEFTSSQWTSPFFSKLKARKNISIFKSIICMCFYFPALETVTKMDGESGCTGFPFWSFPKPCRQCFTGLCSGKASCSYPGMSVFRLQASQYEKQLFEPMKWETPTWQLISTPSRLVRFSGGTANTKGQWKAGRKALFHPPTTP